MNDPFDTANLWNRSRGMIMKKILFLVVLFCCVVTLSFAAESDDQLGGSDPTPDLVQDDYLNEEIVDEEFDGNDIYDPLEPLNRVFFEFNDKLYFWVLKPVKTGYSYVVPIELRECVGNFFNNLASPIRLINNLLQGRFEDAGVVLSRFLINSTFGVYGLADVALQEYNLEPRLADFGQTLGRYGLGEGVYLVWPVLGPSNIRHSAGIAGDSFASPPFYLDFNTAESVSYFATNRVNVLSLSPSIYEDMKKYSLDPYVAVRQSFYDFRRNFVEKATKDETVY